MVTVTPVSLPIAHEFGELFEDTTASSLILLDKEDILRLIEHLGLAAGVTDGGSLLNKKCPFEAVFAWCLSSVGRSNQLSLFALCLFFFIFNAEMEVIGFSSFFCDQIAI